MKILNIIFVFIFSASIFSQTKLTKEQLNLLPNTIENQFVKTYHKAGSWQDYKMIKRGIFKSLQKNTLDSLSLIKKEIITKQKTINKQNNSITSLNEEVKRLNQELTDSLKNVNSISFFGILLEKSTYSTLVWSIILVLLILLSVFIYKFKNSHILTKNAKNNLLEVEEEFEEYRKKTLEKEQKLRRQLHDALNKN